MIFMLNKKGWGTLEMILLTGGLLIALLIAVYFISILYGSFNNAVSNKEYVDMEIKLENAAREYVLVNNISVSDNQRISYQTLAEKGFINNFVDGNGKKCDGYVRVNIIDGINHYYGFISCNNYQTRNY